MKTFTYLFFFVFLSFNAYNSFAQSSGIVLSAGIESQSTPYPHLSYYIDSYNLNLGIDKCFGSRFVLSTRFRYTKSSYDYTCNKCGEYRDIERELTNNEPDIFKDYYWYDRETEKIGVPITLKFYIPSNGDLQLFVEGGVLFNLFSNSSWVGEYWENIRPTQTVVLGPFAEDEQRTKVGVVDITGIAAIGGEWKMADEWAVILKPYVQYEGYWAVGGMLGVKRLFDR